MSVSMFLLSLFNKCYFRGDYVIQVTLFFDKGSTQAGVFSNLMYLR
ncbi:hypothetical protein D920_01678 [Enterococcus faecalis 13-SD-W-01]|nr:hypothetical protein D920_01678 [Enterococcus faecalis 13-SD-W-01]